MTPDAPDTPPERQPVHEDYDAIVDVATTQGLVTHAVAIAKFTYAFDPGDGDGALAQVAAEPLKHDFRKYDRVPKDRKSVV